MLKAPPICSPVIHREKSRINYSKEVKHKSNAKKKERAFLHAFLCFSVSSKKKEKCQSQENGQKKTRKNVKEKGEGRGGERKVILIRNALALVVYGPFSRFSRRKKQK